MKKAMQISKITLSLALSTSMAFPFLPQSAFAANTATTKSKYISFQVTSATGDDDLLPNLANNPSGNTGSDNGSDVTNPGLLPPITGGPINGGNGNNNGNGNNGGNNNGNNGNNNGNNRPPIFNGGNGNNNGNNNNNIQTPTMTTAVVPAEYSCPLFENRPYDNLNMAIDSLSAVITSSPECQNQKGSMDAVQNNNEQIRTAVSQLQQYMDQPDTAYQNMKVVEDNITKAIQSASNIATIFNNNALVNSSCGRQTMSTGKALLAFNDILTNLAPYALLALSLNPGLGLAAKFAITGGVVLTSSISATGKLMGQYTLDMNNPDHRKAVLQNTCQYTKVARKVRFLQLAQSGQINKITDELEKSIKNYKARFAQPTRELSRLLAYKGTMDKQTGDLGLRLKQDRFETDALDQQLNDSRNDHLMTCMIGQELVQQAKNKDAYPATVIQNLEDSAELAQSDVNIQIVSMKALNETSKRKITILKDKVINDNDGGAIKMCADVTRSWLSGIKQAMKLTENLIYQEKNQIEAELSQNTEYVAWKSQYLKIQDEQNTINRVAKVMKEVAKDNSVIDRSELEQRMSNLRSGLFGVNRTFNFGNSPVLAWIDHTKAAHDRAISSFINNLKTLQRGSYGLTMFGNFDANIKQIAKLNLMDQNMQQMKDVVSSITLENITLKKLPIGSRGHDLACQQLESAWLDWSAALDHLNSTEFMCDMIDSYLDNKVEKGIVEYCRGDVGLNGVKTAASGIDKAKYVLSQTRMNTKYSYASFAKIIGSRLNSLQCPMPAVSVMK